MSPPPKVMAKENDKINRPIVSMKGEEREDVWDEAYAKKEGIILEFDSDSNTGKIKSLPWVSTSTVALLTSASIRFACSDVGGDCCELTGLAIAIVTSAVQTKTFFNITSSSCA